jgi:hypothetical protein
MGHYLSVHSTELKTKLKVILSFSSLKIQGIMVNRSIKGFLSAFILESLKGEKLTRTTIKKRIYVLKLRLSKT